MYVIFHVRNLENGDARGKMLQIAVGLGSSIIYKNGRFLEWSIVLARRPVIWVMHLRWFLKEKSKIEDA
jgi:hypothetical protein